MWCSLYVPFDSNFSKPKLIGEVPKTKGNGPTGSSLNLHLLISLRTQINLVSGKPYKEGEALESHFIHVAIVQPSWTLGWLS